VYQKPLYFGFRNIRHSNPITGGAAWPVPGENHAIAPVRRADLRRDGLLRSEESFIVKDHGGSRSRTSTSRRSWSGDRWQTCSPRTRRDAARRTSPNCGTLGEARKNTESRGWKTPLRAQSEFSRR